MKNRRWFRRLVKQVYGIQDCPALDKYGSRILKREVQKTWRIFRRIIKTSVAKEWKWDSEEEIAYYPKVAVLTYDEFVTFMLHEVAHGWCFYHKEDVLDFGRINSLDEEKVCWQISKLICNFLGIKYHKKSADQSYQFYLCVKHRDIRRLVRIANAMPPHMQMR